MLFKNYYWYFEKALSKLTCEKIIKHGKAKQLKMGTISSVFYE